MLIHMLRLRLADFHWLHENFEFLSQNTDSAQNETFLCNLAPQAKIFEKAQIALKVTLKKVNVLEKLHNLFAFQLGGMLSIMLFFW